MENIEEKPNNNHKKGFGSNPQNINRAGRPKGSRNKASMKQARDFVDANALECAQYLTAIMRNDKEFLDIKSDVDIKTRKAAALDLFNKSIANEKDNKELEEDERRAASKQAPEEEEDEEDADPVFSSTAVDEPPVQ